MSDPHQHHHHHHAGANRRRLTLVLVVTSLFLVVEVAAGILTGSLALLADAGHMLTDVAGLVLAILAMKFAERPPTPEHTYGYYRVEILAALVNAMLLLGVSGYILVEAAERLGNPPAVASGGMIAVATAAFGVNLFGLFMLRSGAEESLNVKGAYFEVLSDMLSSIGTIVAGIVILRTGWYYADPLVSAAIGLFILPRTWTLLREAIGVLLEGTPTHVDLVALRRAMEGLPGVERTHDLHVWTLTSGVYAMSAHAVLCDGGRDDEVLAAIQECVRSSFRIAHVTVQLERQRCQDTHGHE